ncbi:MAG: alpha-amylase family protein, partial [Actinobacteria bacterium]|nr:alpha-amylase family protein [Actinomycetota bacterium]MCA1721548.1 alpha-amylase family protein [Actinomycetota bacterium]
IHPDIGTIGDFTELIHQADNRGLRVIIDLVVNHTSDQHPWFQSARSSPDSPYRDWYVWSDTEPSDRRQGMVFPGQQKETWTYDRTAKAWYYHRFYDFQPDLNTANPLVQDEIERILGFWLSLGVSGFRMDAAPFIIELTEPGNPNSPKDFGQLTKYRERISWRRGDAVVLAEANVENEELVKYFGDEGGSNNRLPMLFDFVLSVNCLLALARGKAQPVLRALASSPPIPNHAQWATFLRNHDEVDLSRLTPEEQQECFAAFGPDPDMQLYGRGIRRRLAPMLDNDPAMLRLAYSLQFTLPGTPVIRYGEELGMGDDLSLPEREALRTPMQWSDTKGAGFSSGNELVRPVIAEGPYGYPTVNVARARRDPDSLLQWFEQMIRTLRECPEVGTGVCTPVDVADEAVLAHRFEAPEGVLLFLHNLGRGEVVVDVGKQPGQEGDPVELFSDRGYDAARRGLRGIALGPRGYRWLRLRRTA